MLPQRSKKYSCPVWLLKQHTRHSLIVEEHRIFWGDEKKISKNYLVKKTTFYLKVSSPAEEIIKRIVVLNLLLLSQGMLWRLDLFNRSIFLNVFNVKFSGIGSRLGLNRLYLRIGIDDTTDKLIFGDQKTIRAFLRWGSPYFFLILCFPAVYIWQWSRIEFCGYVTVQWSALAS